MRTKQTCVLCTGETRSVSALRAFSSSARLLNTLSTDAAFPIEFRSVFKGGFITMWVKGGGFLDHEISLRVVVTCTYYVYSPRGISLHLCSELLQEIRLMGLWLGVGVLRAKCSLSSDCYFVKLD